MEKRRASSPPRARTSSFARWRFATPSRTIHDAEEEDASPHYRFISLQNKAASALTELDALVGRLYEMRDDADQVLIDRHGLRRDIMGGLPETIIKIRDNVVVALEDEAEPLDDPTDEMQTMEAIESAFDNSSEPIEDRPEAA